MKKLYATDFDKTFYISENDLENNMELVSKFRDKGNIFSIITGRGAESFDVVKIISELENISRENVVVSGDGKSDIDIIKYYNGYKMIVTADNLRKINVKCVESVSCILEELI